MMFVLLGVALFVDGIDGMFARQLDVPARLPRWSGDVLDLVVDFVTYVLVPAFAWRAADCCRRSSGDPAAESRSS